jgi:hypothetical protein
MEEKIFHINLKQKQFSLISLLAYIGRFVGFQP